MEKIFGGIVALFGIGWIFAVLLGISGSSPVYITAGAFNITGYFHLTVGIALILIGAMAFVKK